MDRQEFERRTQIIRDEVEPEVFAQVQEEVQMDERVQAMAHRIKDLRLSKKSLEADQLIDQNRDLIDQVRNEVLEQQGFNINLEKLEEEAEARRQDKIKEIHSSLTGEESEDDILKTFGLVDEEGHLGEHSVDSPLFKERTRLAFAAYTSSVTAFKALVDYNNLMGVPTKNTGKANLLRRDAHDRVSNEVAEDLGLDFKTSRKLVAKIRDSKIPGSGEKEVYSRSSLRLGRRLAERYNGDLAEIMEDETRPIFKTEEDDSESHNHHH
jgi:hypothetical protein